MERERKDHRREGRKRLKLKRERNNHGRQGRPNLKKARKRRQSSGKEKPSKKIAWFFLSLSHGSSWFLIFLHGPLFHGSSFPSLLFNPFFYDDSTRAVQAVPLAHNVERCLRASAASLSLHPQSGAQVGLLLRK